jgi:hypothetical protein
MDSFDYGLGCPSTPTITPTPTPFPCGASWNFDDATVQGWALNTQYDKGFTALAPSTVQAQDGTHSLAITCAFAQASTTTAGGLLGTSTALNLSGRIVTAWLWVPAGMSNATNSSGAYVYVKTGAGYTWQSGPWTTLPASGGWTPVSFNLSATAGVSDVRELGLKVGLGTGAPDWSGTIYLDSIDYGVGCSTKTPTVSFSPSPTPSPAAGSATSTRTPTQTASLTETPSATASRTQSPSPSVSPSSSATRTPSATRTSTTSPSQTATASATPTISPTFTDVPFGSTLTNTPTITETYTASPSASPTLPDTFTETATASETAMDSATPTATEVDTATFTGTPTPPPALSSATATATASATPTPPAPVSSATSTATPILTATCACLPGSPTLTATPTRTATPSPTQTLFVTPAGPTATSTRTRYVTPQLYSDYGVLKVLPLPNPNPGSLMVKLEGPADKLSWKTYTRNMVCVGAGEKRGDIPGPGWARVDLPAGSFDGLVSGTYYLVVSSERKGAVSQTHAIQKLTLLR